MRELALVEHDLALRSRVDNTAHDPLAVGEVGPPEEDGLRIKGVLVPIGELDSALKSVQRPIRVLKVEFRVKKFLPERRCFFFQLFE